MSDTTKTPLTAQEIEDWHNRLAANKSLDPRKWPEAIEVGAMMFRDFPRLLSMLTPAPLSPDVEAAEKAWGLFWEKHKLPDEAFIAPGYVVADDIAAFADEYARAVRAPRS